MSDIILVFKSCYYFLAAFIALIVGITTLTLNIFKIMDYMKKIKSQAKPIKIKLQEAKMAKIRNLMLISIIILLVGIGLLGVAFTELPPNVVLTNAAWDAYKRKDYKKAIQIANEVIFQFGPTANRMQEELIERKISEPPLGKVSEEKKKEIFRQGPLNDVATAWFIKGMSFERLDKNQEAIRAYIEAERFSHARIYDPSWDGFWSPAKTARDKRLDLGNSN